jgi:hypothetical protein
MMSGAGFCAPRPSASVPRSTARIWMIVSGCGIRKQFRHVRGEDVGEKIADIGEDGAAFFYRGGDAREVGVERAEVYY